MVLPIISRYVDIIWQELSLGSLSRSSLAVCPQSLKLRYYYYKPLPHKLQGKVLLIAGFTCIICPIRIKSYNLLLP